MKSNGHYPKARPAGGIGNDGHAGQDDLDERHTNGEVVVAWDCAENCPVRLLDEQSGERTSGGGIKNRAGRAESPSWRQMEGRSDPKVRASTYETVADTGGASRFMKVFAPDDAATRFFYTAKASRAERNKGLEGMPESRGPVMSDRCINCGKGRMDGRRDGACCGDPLYESMPARGLVSNHHPTVKSLDLMSWLVRLVTPPGGTILDPFTGSGSTLVAADRLGFDAIGIEAEQEYVAIAEARCKGDAPMFASVAVAPARQAALPGTEDGS